MGQPMRLGLRNDTDLSEKVGYLTRAVEDNARNTEKLSTLVTKHMEQEEKERKVLSKQLLVLAGGVMIIAADSLPWDAIISVVRLVF